MCARELHTTTLDAANTRGTANCCSLPLHSVGTTIAISPSPSGPTVAVAFGRILIFGQYDGTLDDAGTVVLLLIYFIGLGGICVGIAKIWWRQGTRKKIAKEKQVEEAEKNEMGTVIEMIGAVLEN